jgi:hypothetical protein
VNLDPSAAIGRAQEILNGLWAALPGMLVGAIVFAGPRRD